MFDLLTPLVIRLAEAGWLPDNTLRLAIRELLRRRIRMSVAGNAHHRNPTQVFAARMRTGPLLEAAQVANQQHYEVPAEFFRVVLGKHAKYSCAFWESTQSTLDQAEESMLKLTCERAAVENGMRILELGCGWGSLSLWLAENFPQSQIVAVSNSQSQREFIQYQSRTRRLSNLQVITCNVSDFETRDVFDRILSVEMFEHFLNHALLLEKIARWLAPDGKLFVHLFCHREIPYRFETTSPSDWMARHFFTGGIMPSAELLNVYDEHLCVEQSWNVNGMHYSRTCEAWLGNLDDSYGELLSLFTKSVDRAEAKVCLQRWRMFFLACSELFRYHAGQEWFVAHYLMRHTEPGLESGTADARPEMLNTS